MAFDLASISTAVTVSAPRIVLLGTEKVGKSTFASQWPNPVFLPIKGEQGLDGLEGAKFPTITTYTELMQALAALDSDQHDRQTVIIDSISTLEPVIWKHVCETGNVKSIEKFDGGYGKGYVEALRFWRDMTDALDRLRARGMVVILIGHVIVKPFNDPMEEPYDVYKFDINDKASAALVRWADAIWFARNTKTRVERTEKDVMGGKVKDVGGPPKLYTQKKPAHPGGGRHIYGRLPYEIELNYNAVMAEINKLMAPPAVA